MLDAPVIGESYIDFFFALIIGCCVYESVSTLSEKCLRRKVAITKCFSMLPDCNISRTSLIERPFN